MALNLFTVGLNLLKKSSLSQGKRHFSSIGFVGLGNMGNYMANNLIKKGHKIVVYDVNRSALTNLVEAGAKEASSAAELSKNSQMVITMLPTNDHVWESYTGNDGLLSTAEKNTLFVDSSTIDPSVSQKVHQEATKKGAKFIDGPVSGGVVGARDGTLTFMVGGEKEQYDRAKPILEAMGTRIVHCGDVGMGQVAKLCNNMLLAISMIGVSEVVNLADRLGLDPKVMTSILNTSTGRCWSSEVYPPVPGIIDTVPSSNNYEGGFLTHLMTKDLGLAQAAATRSSTPIPLGSLAHQVYRMLMTHGHANRDFSIIYQYLKNCKV
ncbi:3-hydroxyisobutyrate dehydrogenase, mitochondrial [Chelonus insularis]|uniref:3-hydroxyisobutyrate dehydrogenase, mitochondrial n=1 Tax=Chelonus insularis TaxID=460826 RepID=UPI00158D4AFE|nr:3-hydroxyisobutyrate dehydrogenase, mitochondrial [Chelonus insularis]XP_034952700.1 3-hydroxyisobutyrate dehydrogenase, mitochondrial [Chelonus insularis]